MKKIALLGFGVVGSGTAEVLNAHAQKIADYVGEAVEIKYILDLRDFEGSPFAPLIVHDFDTILQDDEVVLVAEMMGGIHPAYDFTKSALQSGKHVVTSNKAVVAYAGVELLKIAKEKGVHYGFEASVGGGIPVLNPMQKELTGNNVTSVAGILNGTTNYILTEMKTNGLTFDTALKNAQALGYAEKDPTADVEGMDAARKICILTAVATGKLPSDEAVLREGICQITGDMVNFAEKIGGSVKLIGKAKLTGDAPAVAVMPHFVVGSHPLCHVDGVMNGVCVEGDSVGKVMFYGAGAGKLPTASAVVADIASILAGKAPETPVWEPVTPVSPDAVWLCVFNGCPMCQAKAEKAFGVSAVRSGDKEFYLMTPEMSSEVLTEVLKKADLNLAFVLPVLQ